jgi:hypothetical protein
MAAINSCPFCNELKVFDDQRELTRHLAQLHTRSPTLYCYRRESALFAGLVVCRAPFCRVLCSAKGFSKHSTRKHAPDPILRLLGPQCRSLDAMTNAEINAIAYPPNLGFPPDSDSEPDDFPVNDFPVVVPVVLPEIELPAAALPAEIDPPVILPPALLAPVPIPLSDLRLTQLRRFFNTGLFRIHYQHEAPLRLVVFRLLQRITGSVDHDLEWHQSHVCALLILPGVVHRLMILKRPSLRQFFRDCAASTNGETSTFCILPRL